MDSDPKTPQWVNNDKAGFAWPTVLERWPTILTQAIDDVHRAVSDVEGDEKKAEGKSIVEKLGKLKYELQHDRKLTPLEDDGSSDIGGYNKELEERGSPSWLSAPWLFTECYMYRRIQTYFALSTHWRGYDIFARSKTSGFKSSGPAVLELAAKYRKIVTELETTHTIKAAKTEQDLAKAEELLFIDMCEICLWGNKTDLSLLTNLTNEDIQKLQGSEVRKASEKNIIVNDLSTAFQALNKVRKSGQQERQVDIVLDNAGFELYVDLILAGYLLSVGLATTVVLHPKSFPWFVSDVTPPDFMGLLNSLRDPQHFFGSASEGQPAKQLTEEETSNLNFLFENWGTFHAEGKLIIRPNLFWTEGGSFWRLPATAPELYESLKESELVIFKGDLNYRKLTADAMWDPTTPFPTAIGPLGSQSGLRLLALRTCKGDVIVGLPPGKDEEIRATKGGGGDSGKRKWSWTGEWAVIQFNDGK